MKRFLGLYPTIMNPCVTAKLKDRLSDIAEDNEVEEDAHFPGVRVYHGGTQWYQCENRGRNR